MRHKVKTDRFGRFSSYRKATLKSITISLLERQKIITTKAKAKSARKLVEKTITLGKKNTLFAKRRAFSILCDHNLVQKLFDQIAPVFSKRVGGYTRIIPYRYQRGDNAQLVIFELTEKYKDKKAEKKIKEEKSDKIDEVKTKEPDVVKKEKATQIKPETIEKKEQKKVKPVKQEIKKKPETVQPEPQPPVQKEEQKKPEEKKPKKLFGRFKGLFKKKDSK